MNAVGRRLARVGLALLCGCAVPGPAEERDPFARGVWPFWTADRRAWAGTRQTRAAGPLLEWEVGEAGARFALRPWLSHAEGAGESRWDVLYPLAARRETPEREDAWLLLLATARRDNDSPRNEQLLGLGFRGRTADGRRYGGVFPFGGRLLERLGFDRIDFLLWPLYARAVRGGYTETQLLWPLFAWGRGDGRFALRVWPLFGIERREGRFDRRFWLWPFVHRRLERLDSARPQHSFYVLPLYGRRDAGPRHSRFYAFPLYARQWDESRPEFGRLDLLWPLWSRLRDAGGDGGLGLRPLFTWARTGPETRIRFLLGAFGTTVVRSESVDERWWRLLWVSRFGRRDEGGTRTRRAELWPLFRFAALEGDGLERGSLRVPYLLPMRGLEPDRWDLHWNRLFQVYERRWLAGERRSSWLWGFRETRRAPGERWVSWGGFWHTGRIDPTRLTRGGLER